MKGLHLTLGFVVCFAVFGYLTYSLATARRRSCEMRCENTFKQVSLALLNYHDDYSSFPSAKTYGMDAMPMHSWRSRILVYMAAVPPIYDDQDRWNGDRNVRLINGHVFQFEKTAPDIKSGGPYEGPIDFARWYRCCAHLSEHAYSANIVAVTGPETAWPISRQLSQKDITDGPENTILVVETRKADLYWSEPCDLQFDSMSFSINGPESRSIGSHHSRGPCVAMANGDVYRLAPSTPPDVVRGLLTIAGGEDLQAVELVRRGWLIPWHG